MIVIRNANYPLGLTSGLVGSSLSGLHIVSPLILPPDLEVIAGFYEETEAPAYPQSYQWAEDCRLFDSIPLFVAALFHFPVFHLSRLPPSLLKRSLGKRVAQYMFPKYPRITFSACKDSFFLSEPIEALGRIWKLQVGYFQQKDWKRGGKNLERSANWFAARTKLFPHVYCRSLSTRAQHGNQRSLQSKEGGRQ